MAVKGCNKTKDPVDKKQYRTLDRIRHWATVR